jgi:hypothetical protein
MFFASKIWWARMAFTLLATGILVQGVPRSAAGSDFNKETLTPFVITDEIKKIQETLRNK